MSKNKELKELYEKFWGELETNAKQIIQEEEKQENKPANPLLLKIDEDEYESSDLKVMIFGQETWGWNKSFGKSIEEGMSRYESFFIKEGFYKGRSKSVFWKAFDFFKNELNKHHNNKKIVYLWNNISKIGRDGERGTTKKIRNLEQTYFPIIKEEIKILKPDIIIFLTGNRNSDLKFHFSDVKFKKYQNSATLLSKNGNMKFQPTYQVISKDLPTKSVKIYHPSFFGGFNNIKNDAIRLITQEID